MNLEKFTDRAKGFLQSAQTVAIRMNHQRITPAHLLKALLEDEHGMAAGLIQRAGGPAAYHTVALTGGRNIARLAEQARAEGFAKMGVCAPDAAPEAAERLRA